MKNKIALVGSASVGKSTQGRLLSETTRIPLHTELESRLIKKLIREGTLKSKGDFTVDQSIEFQYRALRIRERLIKQPQLISDRTAGELFIYYKMYLGEHRTPEQVAEFSARCQKVMEQYDQIFLFPFGQIPIEKDNYRNTNPAYQQRVHRLVKEMLDDFDLDFVRLQERQSSKEERFDEIVSWLK